MNPVVGVVKRMLDPVALRVRLMVGRGVLRLVDDAKKCQSLQVELLSDEVRDGVERFQEYGFTSVPEADAEAIAVSVGGNRAHVVVVATEDRRYRPKNLSPGDTCLYNRNGERVYLDDANDLVNLGAKSAADFVALAADTKAEIKAVRDNLADLVAAFNAHMHATAAVGAPSTPTPGAGIPATAPAAVGDVKATKVKAT